MGEKMNSKRQYTGCACRCGQATYNTYRPGHDSKHVSKLVRATIEASIKSPWDTGQMWQAAMRTLPTDALRRKYRTALYRSADRHLGSVIDRMNDLAWQRAIHLQALLARDDEFFNRNNPFGERVLAVYAAALGWTRHAVNMKHS
jgi:hypothetical protein